MTYAQNTMKRIGYGLIAAKKSAIRSEKHGAYVEKGDVEGQSFRMQMIRGR
jgi:hypothetical protein